jgi:hypothetical protein
VVHHRQASIALQDLPLQNIIFHLLLYINKLIIIIIIIKITILYSLHTAQSLLRS